jgi:hypothetical protein
MAHWALSREKQQTNKQTNKQHITDPILCVSLLFFIPLEQLWV